MYRSLLVFVFVINAASALYAANAAYAGQAPCRLYETTPAATDNSIDLNPRQAYWVPATRCGNDAVKTGAFDQPDQAQRSLQIGSDTATRVSITAGGVNSEFPKILLADPGQTTPIHDQDFSPTQAKGAGTWGSAH